MYIIMYDIFCYDNILKDTIHYMFSLMLVQVYDKDFDI